MAIKKYFSHMIDQKTLKTAHKRNEIEPKTQRISRKNAANLGQIMGPFWPKKSCGCGTSAGFIHFFVLNNKVRFV
jgi:hypothetical protein